MSKSTPDEVWLPVVGYEGAYQVSNWGRVRSLPGFARGARIRKATPAGKGHLRVELSLYNQPRSIYVHRMVLEAFVGPCPDGMEGCHNDGDPTNNHLDNLRWDTRSENVRDAIRHGTYSNGRGTRTHCMRGHEFTPRNTYRKPGRNTRECRICRAARAKGLLAVAEPPASGMGGLR